MNLVLDDGQETVRGKQAHRHQCSQSTSNVRRAPADMLPVTQMTRATSQPAPSALSSLAVPSSSSSAPSMAAKKLPTHLPSLKKNNRSLRHVSM